MATLTELHDLFQDPGLKKKVRAALVVSAYNLIVGVAPTAADRQYAALVFRDPAAEAAKALLAVLAENSGLTVAQIQGASDAAVQANVDAVTPQLRDAEAGV